MVPPPQKRINIYVIDYEKIRFSELGKLTHLNDAWNFNSIAFYIHKNLKACNSSISPRSLMSHLVIKNHLQDKKLCTAAQASIK
jgi:hypothetical protein